MSNPNSTHYVTYFKETASAGKERGWYAFQASIGENTNGQERIIVHKNFYNYSKASRGEAVEKLFKTRVGLTRNHEFHHTGIECLDYKFDPSRPLVAA